ncbi:hypothetical protein RRG08_032689 [Elysia crispata]|uniref:Uncharacterized protein n=1 Tax=Elysia crispata TaxID=231223 RepID=A0AAE0XZV5_9GAST|nr:hypothetical protein RRG08_032689 [Elysia crispata]
MRNSLDIPVPNLPESALIPLDATSSSSGRHRVILERPPFLIIQFSLCGSFCDGVLVSPLRTQRSIQLRLHRRWVMVDSALSRGHCSKSSLLFIIVFGRIFSKPYLSFNCEKKKAYLSRLQWSAKIQISRTGGK